jgi:predicted O-linked N-acetylglucosamine transferase (SPINDLY family)
MTERLRGAFDRFLDVRGRSDDEVAQASRELGIDIAVDLMGFTQDSRPGIFARRAAPLQVSYLGYAGTTGAPYIDYLVADRIVIPEQSRRFYSEKVLYLPNSYFPNSYEINRRKSASADPEPSRARLGLPETGVVFCCFNSAYKIAPGTFESWMRILAAVRHSVLWLLTDNPTAIRNLRREAERCGVSGTRLTFAPPVPLAQHLPRHRAADLFLDTLPCGAHTTATDALWTGLPVLTLAGESLAARVAASLLTAVGLPELITITREDYEALAIALATDRERLVALRGRLATNRLTMPLFDTGLLTRHLERGYREIHRRHQAGLDPEDVLVPAEPSG